MTSTLSNRPLIAHATGFEGAPIEVGLEAYQAMAGIEIVLSAELGLKWISVDELLRLRVDDVLVLSRPTGENVDLFAGDVLIGNAELLATDEKLAIRVADLLEKPASVASHDPRSAHGTGVHGRNQTKSDDD